MAPKTIRFGSAKLTPEASGERTMTGTRRSPARIAGFIEHGFAAGRGDAAAEAVGNLVVAQHGGEALDVALMRRGEHDARLRLPSGF